MKSFSWFLRIVFVLTLLIIFVVLFVCCCTSAEVKEEEGSGVWKLLRASDILGSLDSEVLIPGEDEDE